jgi:hypothetical protein
MNNKANLSKLGGLGYWLGYEYFLSQSLKPLRSLNGFKRVTQDFKCLQPDGQVAIFRRSSKFFHFGKDLTARRKNPARGLSEDNPNFSIYSKILF